jgi:pimeloyl-ACP methyl ester carboxylesterase
MRTASPGYRERKPCYPAAMASVPIVYLPGGGGRSSFWRPVADRLAYRAAPIVFGYPGFGDVPSEPSIRSLSDLYDALLRILPESFDLVAQSMGNVLALRMAIEQPGRVRRLVVTAASGGIPVAPLGAVEWRESLRQEQPHAPTWFIDDDTDLTPRLASLVAPTLLLFADEDPLAPVRVGEFLRDRIAGSRLEVLNGSHSFAQEQPDRVASLIAAHLA